jgi:hypothetical protein
MKCNHKCLFCLRLSANASGVPNSAGSGKSSIFLSSN